MYISLAEKYINKEDEIKELYDSMNKNKIIYLFTKEQEYKQKYENEFEEIKKLCEFNNKDLWNKQIINKLIKNLENNTIEWNYE